MLYTYSMNRKSGARLELSVKASQSGREVRSLLKKELGLSSALIGRLKRTETGLTVNGQRVFTNRVLQAGDVLAVDLGAAERPTDIPPVAMALDILYEDEHLLVVNKSAPLACIPSSLAPGEPTLASGLLHHLGEGAAVHLVNRLDRGTTGLLAAAKNAWAHDRLRLQLHTGAFRRWYLAVCVGAPDPAEGTVSLPIGRSPGSAIARQVDSAGQSAITDYRTLERAGRFALVELTPRTGRTHQIRVHMAALGCPLAGDWLYGTEDRALIGRPALHAVGLELTHPATGRTVSLTAPLPEDIKDLLERENG